MTDRFAADNETWIDPAGRNLSERIWGNRQGLRQHIDRLLTDAIDSGITVADLTTILVRYVSPTYARSGEGRARYAANRLASNEMRRANAIATRDVAMTDPAGGYLRYSLGSGHIEGDECTELANRDSGYGLGVYPAKDCPLPPRHPNCPCTIGPPPAGLGQYGDMDAVVEALRVEFELEDPPDLPAEELAIFRRETAQVRQDVQLMFNAWFEQTGLVTTDQLVDESPTVREWVSKVQESKQRRRG